LQNVEKLVLQTMVQAVKRKKLLKPLTEDMANLLRGR